jgi:hypothetical protein
MEVQVQHLRLLALTMDPGDIYDHFSLRSEQHSEDAPVLAPVLHRYGRCLLEHAIATSGALGGGGGAAGASEAPLPKRKAESADGEQ